jgi:hypothetical protein
MLVKGGADYKFDSGRWELEVDGITSFLSTSCGAMFARQLFTVVDDNNDISGAAYHTAQGYTEKELDDWVRSGATPAWYLEKSEDMYFEVVSDLRNEEAA